MLTVTARMIAGALELDGVIAQTANSSWRTTTVRTGQREEQNENTGWREALPVCEVLC